MTSLGRVTIGIVTFIVLAAATWVAFRQLDLRAFAGSSSNGTAVLRLEMPAAKPSIPTMPAVAQVTAPNPAPSSLPINAKIEIPRSIEPTSLSAAPPPTEAKASRKAVKTAARIAQIQGGANVRSGASIEKKRLDLLKSGEPVKIRRKEGRWYAIELEDGREGYVHSRLVTKPGEQ